MSLAGAATTAELNSIAVERALNALSYGPREKRRLLTTPKAALGYVNDGAHGVAAGSAVVWEGRLDNRNALIAELDAQDLMPSEADLFWLAWRRWGDDFLDRVYGEFACAIWDAERGELVLGRDALGMRPLLYWVGGRDILFASEPRGLWSDPRVEKAVNPRRMGEWLSLRPLQGAASLYQAIYRVPPGHVAVWCKGEVRTHRYWRPEKLPLLRLDSDEAYVDALRGKLEAAVARRLPASGGVGSHLSAGLDSALVTVTAARLLAGKGRRLTAFTAAPAQPVDPALYPDRLVDEFPLAAALAAFHSNIDHVRIANDAQPMVAAVRRQSAATEAPVLNAANASWAGAIEAEAQRRGIRVMLSGETGNMSLSYEGWSLLPALLRRGRLLSLLRAWVEIRRSPQPQSLLSLASLTLGPLLPPAWLSAVRRAFGREEAGMEDKVLLNQEILAGQTDEDPSRDRANGRRRRIAVLHKFDARGALYAGAKRLTGVEICDPTADRELVEFCLAVPEDQYLHAGESRSLARRLLAPDAPLEFMAERRKGFQAADWQVSLDRARDDLAREIEGLEQSDIASRYIDVPRLKKLLEDWPNQDWRKESVRNNYMLAFSRGMAAGHFIRRIEGRND